MEDEIMLVRDVPNMINKNPLKDLICFERETNENKLESFKE